MGKIGVMMSEDRPEGLMSSHFGKDQWLMLADSEDGVPEFVRNEGLNGRSAAGIAMQRECTDVILVDIGDGALGHLQAARIRAWAAPGLVTGREALRLFAEGQLSLVPDARAATRHGGRHGDCDCQHAGHHAGGCCPSGSQPAT